MAVKAPDFTSCSPKVKCPCGTANEGDPYDPSEPCEENEEFDAENCECVPTWVRIRYKILGSNVEYRYCCDSTPHPDTGCTACDGTVAPGYPIVSEFTRLEEDVLLTAEEWQTRYVTGINQDKPCNTYEEFANLVTTTTWRGPGIRYISNDISDLNGTCDHTVALTSDSCIDRCDSFLGSTYINGSVEEFEYFDS